MVRKPRSFTLLEYFSKHLFHLVMHPVHLLKDPPLLSKAPNAQTASLGTTPVSSPLSRSGAPSPPLPSFPSTSFVFVAWSHVVPQLGDGKQPASPLADNRPTQPGERTGEASKSFTLFPGDSEGRGHSRATVRAPWVGRVGRKWRETCLHSLRSLYQECIY